MNDDNMHLFWRSTCLFFPPSFSLIHWENEISFSMSPSLHNLFLNSVNHWLAPHFSHNPLVQDGFQFNGLRFVIILSGIEGIGGQMIDKQISSVDLGKTKCGTLFFLKNLLIALTLRFTFSCNGQAFCTTSLKEASTRLFGTNLRNVVSLYGKWGNLSKKRPNISFTENEILFLKV